MDTVPSLESVVAALRKLKHDDGDSDAKDKSSAWLTEIQNSEHGWHVSEELLSQQLDEDSSLFAVQTLRAKILKSFQLLEPTKQQLLKNSLVNHCTKINENTPQVVVTQLSKALSDVILQMPSISTTVSELVRRFGENVENWTFLLTFLTILPHQMESLEANKEQKKVVCEQLACATKDLTVFMSRVINTKVDVEHNAQVYRCLEKWFGANSIDLNHVMVSPLLKASFITMVDSNCPSNLHSAASGFIRSVVEDVKEYENDDAPIFSLLDLVHSLPLTGEDQEKLCNVCAVVTAMAECVTDNLLATPGEGLGDLKIIDSMLVLMNKNMPKVAMQTFSFWAHLADTLTEDEDTLGSTFDRHVQSFIEALCKLCQVKEETEASLEGKSHKTFRDHVRSVLADMDDIVIAADCWRQLFDVFAQGQKDGSWCACEAALFIMKNVAEAIDVKTDCSVPQVLQAIFAQSDATPLELRQSSIAFVGSMSKWLAKHATYQEPAFQHLLSNLMQEGLHQVSASSLRKFSFECTATWKRQIDEVFKILETISSNPSFPISATSDVIRGATRIIGDLEVDDLVHWFNMLCRMNLDSLKLVVDQGPVDFTMKDRHTDPAVYLDILSEIFRITISPIHLEPTHPCKKTFTEEVWPVLSMCFDKYQTNVAVIERLSRCVRFGVRLLGAHSVSLLTPLVTKLVEIYAKEHHSCCLYLGSVLVDEWSVLPETIPSLVDMLQDFARPALEVLSGDDALKENSETVDDFFRLAIRFMQKAPVEFSNCAVSKAIVQLAMKVLVSKHKPENDNSIKTVGDFVVTLLTAVSPSEHNVDEGLKVMIDEACNHIVDVVVTTCIKTQSMTQMMNYTPLVLAMAPDYEQVTGKSLKQTVAPMITELVADVRLEAPNRGAMASYIATISGSGKAEDPAKTLHDLALTCRRQ